MKKNFLKTMHLIINPYRGFSRETWRIFAAGFVNSMSMTLTVYLSLYLTSLGYNIERIGAVLMLYGLGGIAGAYIGGWATDRWNASLVCRVALFICAGLHPLLPFMKSFSGLIVFSFSISFFVNMFRPAFILVLSSGDRRENLEDIIALRRVAINLGMAAGAAICGLLAARSFLYIFWFNAIASLTACLIIWNVKEIKEKTAKKVFSKGDLPREFYLSIFLMLFVLVVFNQTHGVYPIYLQNNFKLTTEEISLVFSINGILIAGLQLPISRFFQNIAKSSTSRWTDRTICALGVVLLCGGFAVLPWISSHVLIYTSCVLWTFGEIIFFPSQLAAILRMVDKNKGHAMGIYQVVFSLGSFMAPFVGTFLYARHPNLIWHTSLTFGLAVTFIFLQFDNVLQILNRSKEVLIENSSLH